MKGVFRRGDGGVDLMVIILLKGGFNLMVIILLKGCFGLRFGGW